MDTGYKRLLRARNGNKNPPFHQFSSSSVISSEIFLWGDSWFWRMRLRRLPVPPETVLLFPLCVPLRIPSQKSRSQQSCFLSSEDANKALRSTFEGRGRGVDFIFWGVSEWHGGQNTTCQNCRFEHSSHRRHVLESQITTKIIPILLTPQMYLSLQIFKVGGNFENGPKNRRRRHPFFSPPRGGA